MTHTSSDEFQSHQRTLQPSGGTHSQSAAEGTRSGRAKRDAQAPTFSVSQNPFLYPLDLLDEGLRQLNPTAELNAERPEWWLIHTKPRQEKKLAEQLRAIGVEHFLPVTKCTAFTRGRPRTTLAPLFPGYLFLRGDFQQRRSALETNRIVTSHLVADEASLTRQLWDLADLIEKQVPLRIEERLVSGQQVRVKSGLLRDKRGVVMKRVGKTRLFVFVNELLGGVSLEIEQHLLEPYA